LQEWGEDRAHGFCRGPVDVKVLRATFDPDAFFGRLARATSRVLFLDYDGTLAPFRVDPSQARPYDGVRERLSRIREAGTRLVVVSGRPAAEVRDLVGLWPAPEVWGTHGWERAAPGAPPEPVRLTEDARRGLEEGIDRPGVAGGPGRIERKPAAVALHVRGLDEDTAREALERARRAWAPLARERGLSVRSFDGGLELLASGRDKGEAVRTVLREAAESAAGPMSVGPGGSEGPDAGPIPGTERVEAAYLGDDLTDEDAFRALRGRGAAVLVRPEPRETEADAWLKPPGELLTFLDRWIAATSG